MMYMQITGSAGKIKLFIVGRFAIIKTFVVEY